MDETRYREAERRMWQSVGVIPTEQRLRLERTNVIVRIQEVGEGPAVVFVHGASNSGTSWSSLVARLEGFRCLLLDRPGCGLSEPLETMGGQDSLREMAQTLVVDVLDALGLASAHLVATSFGGYIALHTAATHAERIERMVHFGWPVGAPVARVPMFMRLLSVPWLGRIGSAIPPNERMVRAMFRRIGLRQALESGGVTQEVLDCYLALLRDTDTLRNELRSVAGKYITLRGLDERLIVPDDVLASIRTPIHFVWGEEDPFGGADVARRIVDRIPTAGLELVPGAGHAVWLDDADHAAKATIRFLTG